jgi:hypothetical protein
MNLQRHLSRNGRGHILGFVEDVVVATVGVRVGNLLDEKIAHGL